MKKLIISFILFMTILPLLAQQKSAKRGLGWDEKTQDLSVSTISKMAPGISWIYNWGVAPDNEISNLGPGKDMEYIPMCWNNSFDETKLRNYLNSHPGVKYLLGYNEPNFSAQSNMTPQQAANAWPRLESLAQEFNLRLVAPALNFSGEKVGGRVWSPYEWLDEFLRLYPTARIDNLALHCYMNWFTANTWFATEYFYADLYNTAKKDVYGKYPNIVAFLDNYKAANGHFPRMLLTEFCAWENDGTIKNVDFQIDQMTQKVQKLEQSDLIEGYAWFIGNANAATYPYMSIFERNTPSSELSTLGKVYVYMSSFDTNKYYTPSETIAAKDYIDASTDNLQVKLRPNSESGSEIPLQVEMQQSAWASYQVDIPADGEYTVTMHINSTTANSFRLYKNTTGSANRLANATLPSTNGNWQDVTFTTTLPAGKYNLLCYNMGSSFLVNSMQITRNDTGISSVSLQPSRPSAIYDLMGRKVADRSELDSHFSTLPKGIYIIDGKRVAIK